MRDPISMTFKVRSGSFRKGWILSKSRKRSFDTTIAPFSCANNRIHSSAFEPLGTLWIFSAGTPTSFASSEGPRSFFPFVSDQPILASKKTSMSRPCSIKKFATAANTRESGFCPFNQAILFPSIASKAVLLSLPSACSSGTSRFDRDLNLCLILAARPEELPSS